MYKEKLYIRNMVCDRCIKVVREELEKNGLHISHIVLGEAEVISDNPLNKTIINQILLKNGFELLEDKAVKTIEKIKTLSIDLVQHNLIKNMKYNLSDYISIEVDRDYHTLSTLFSQKEGITIEKYYILQKIEKVKELLMYGELSLSEIAFQLDYSSVAHLSSQFKQITGLTPSEFKKINAGRKPLDKVK